MTFTRACSHFTNFTAGHESRSGRLGDLRFDYPTRHIEADNRLAWHLGGLAQRYRDEDVLYVHLTRDREEVARSFAKRWDSPYRASMIRAFGHGIITRTRDWPEGRRLDVCRHYVDTVTANITEFLRDRPHVNVRLEAVETDFAQFAERAGARGDLAAAIGEWTVRHNASKTPHQETAEGRSE